jgi:hypothetical protein
MKRAQDNDFYIVNFNPDFRRQSISAATNIENLSSEETYFDYCKETGMSQDSQHLLANYAAKIHRSLEGKNTVSSTEIQQILSQLKHLYSRSNQAQKVDLEPKIERLRHLNMLQERFEAKAKFTSSLMGLSVSAFIAAEIFIIVEGTFFSLSWDIMEPISYLMALFNGVAGFAWYYRYISQPECQSFHEYLKQRSIAKQQRRAGVDPKEIESLMQQINK